MNTETLKEYIKRVYQLEVSLYNQKSLYNRIQNDVKNLSNYRGQALKPLITTKGYFDLKGFMSSIMLFGSIGVLIGAFSRIPFFVGTFGGIGVGILIMLYVNYSDLRSAKAENAIINQSNQQIIMNNDEKIKTNNHKIVILNQELSAIRNSYSSTKNILDKFYGMDIIFSKYRNLLAISSFYEYLSAARCTCLEGHEGAYNIFENEKLQHIIIDRLDEVISHLERIESNQFMLYSAIQQSNATTARLSQQLNNVADSLQRIESNSQITAYNSGIVAQNTEFLKWYELLKS